MIQMQTSDHSGNLGGELNLAAEVIQSSEQASDHVGAIAASEMIGAEIIVFDRSLSMCQAAVSIEETARMAFLAPRRVLRRKNWACR